jgi:hypothetical protein
LAQSGLMLKWRKNGHRKATDDRQNVSDRPKVS